MISTKRILPAATAVAALALALAALPGRAAAQPAPGAEIAGHWLATGYLEALERTRSPLAAAAAADLVAILVERDPEAPFYRYSVTSFHEGLNFHIRGFEQKGPLAVIEADSLDDDGAATQRLTLELTSAPDGGRLAAGVPWGEQRVVFRRLPATVQEFVNRLTVAGRYADEQGRAYELAPDGRLEWAGAKGSYEVVIDTYENGCDVVSRSGAKPEETIYTGFRRENGRLAFYQLLEGEEQEHLFECAEKPFLVLTPKN